MLAKIRTLAPCHFKTSEPMPNRLTDPLTSINEDEGSNCVLRGAADPGRAVSRAAALFFATAAVAAAL